ncbi:MAG: DNA circularization N-terminal domain-containing protein [Cyanobacteriota bacterium]
MAVELANIQLNRVHKIATLEQAALVHHRVPGLAGNVVQDLGRDSVRLQIEGIFYGANAKDDLETLRQVYKERKAVDFFAEIVGQAYFSQVIIEQFAVTQSADYPDEFSYCLIVTEYVASTETPAATDQVNQSIAVEAKNLMNIANLSDALQMGLLPEITNPIEPLKGALEPVKEATKNFSEVTQGLRAIFGI